MPLNAAEQRCAGRLSERGGGAPVLPALPKVRGSDYRPARKPEQARNMENTGWKGACDPELSRALRGKFVTCSGPDGRPKFKN